MDYIKKVWRWMWTPAPLRMNYVFALFIILVLYFFFPSLWSAALPELLATFLGILIGYTLGVSSEIKLRKLDEEKRKALENTQLKKKQEYLLKILDEEINENLEALNKLGEVDIFKIPEAFLRTSSWYTARQHLESFEDYEFIEKLFELYFNIEDMNRNIDYLRRHIFFSAVAEPSRDPSRRFLSNAIRMNSYTLRARDVISKDLMYAAYHGFCRMKGYSPLLKNVLTNELKPNIPNLREGKRKIGETRKAAWLGISLKCPDCRGCPGSSYLSSETGVLRLRLDGLDTLDTLDTSEKNESSKTLDKFDNLDTNDQSLLNKIDEFLEILGEVETKSGYDAIEILDFTKFLCEKGWKLPDVKKAYDILKRDRMIFEPRPGYIKRCL